MHKQVHLGQQCLCRTFGGPAEVVVVVGAFQGQQIDGLLEFGYNKLVDRIGQGTVQLERRLGGCYQGNGTPGPYQVEIEQTAYEMGLSHQPVAQGGGHVDPRHLLNHRIGALHPFIQGAPPTVEAVACGSMVECFIDTECGELVVGIAAFMCIVGHEVEDGEAA